MRRVEESADGLDIESAGALADAGYLPLARYVELAAANDSRKRDAVTSPLSTTALSPVDRFPTAEERATWRRQALSRVNRTSASSAELALFDAIVRLVDLVDWQQARIAAREATGDAGSVEVRQLRAVLTQAETPKRRRSDR